MLRGRATPLLRSSAHGSLANWPTGKSKQARQHGGLIDRRRLARSSLRIDQSIQRTIL